jgi:hypothetical protein
MAGGVPVKTLRLPSEQEVEPWYDAVCTLWDDPELYHSMAFRARQIAAERYSEDVSRRPHVDCFTSLRPESVRAQSTSTHS